MIQPSSDRERFVAGAWYLGLGQVVGAFATYGLLAALTRMGAAQYGLWVLVLQLVSYLAPWATLGLNSALIRFCPTYYGFRQWVAAYRMSSRACWWCSLAITLGLWIGARPLAGLLLGDATQWHLIVLASLLFPLEAQFRIGNSFLQVQERLGVYAAITSLRYVGEVVVLASLVFWLPDLELLLGARVVLLLLLVFGQHLVAAPYRGKPQLGPDLPLELKPYLVYGLPMIPAAFIWMLVMGVDRFMLGQLSSLAEVAVYSVADTIAVFLLNCTRPINGILQPRFANTMDRETEETQRYLAGAFKYLAILLFPGTVGLALAAGPAVDFVSHEEFGRAASMIPLLGVAYLLIGMSNPLCHLVFLRKGGGVFLWLYSLCLGVNIGLNWLLIPSLGGGGAVLATLGAVAVYVGGLVASSEGFALRVLARQWRNLSAIAGCSLLMGLVLLAGKMVFPVLDSLLLIPLGIAVYGLAIQTTGLVTLSERKLLLNPLYRLGYMLRAPFRRAQT